VWRFDRLIEGAASGEAVRDSLQAVAELHSGQLLQGVYYEWAEPLHAHFQDQLLDVLVQLAEACERDGDEESAITALVRAISLDPYAEHIYRRLMNLYAKLGRATDIQRAYRELEAALSEGLEAEPTDETTMLKDKLIRELTQSTDA
jgi:DNA-binding SARP family transcriptional activator